MSIHTRPTWGPQARLQADVPKTLTGQTVQRLRRDIIANRLQPSERLTFEKLSRLYGVGSSPLREALLQVMMEGLVQSEEHKGFIVSPINTDEMFDISSLRANFEAQALRLSIKNGGAEWETRVLTTSYWLKKALAQLHACDENQRRAAEDEWELRHRDLHHALCSASGSYWLSHFISILYDHLERYRRYFWNYSDRATGADDEHEQIVSAALDRDADRAEQLLLAHFQTQAELSLMAQTLRKAA